MQSEKLVITNDVVLSLIQTEDKKRLQVEIAMAIYLYHH